MTYSNTLALGRRSSVPSRNQNVISFQVPRHRLGPVSTTIILVILVCLVGLLYLTQVTKTNAYGYQLNSLQSQQTALQNQHNNLEVTAAQLQAATRIQGSAVAKTLVASSPSATVTN